EIPGGQALNPERHLYEEIIYVLEGLGVTEVSSPQNGGKKVQFEWGPGSMFAIPLNAYHRLINGGRDPVVFLAITSAPVMMDLLHNEDFIFNNDYSFSDRYDGSEDYFKTSNHRYRSESGSEVWETNFIADVNASLVDHLRHHKAVGGGTTLFQIAENALVGHIAE
ncbi:MAG: cupin domain-containing protein, partial [Deltaproteobacteria bacterium]|nr:cupin domain-containing protein [Deltaproteobacteria bacterium]